VSTAEAYRSLDETRARLPNRAVPARLRLSGRQWVQKIQPSNSFEEVILRDFPAVAAARKALQESGCQSVLLSGSGSAVFGFVKTKAEANRISRQLRKNPWDVFVASTIS
jgi:4-diphosphocytidyl-2C-methyl-D-erythritol kinase